VFTLIPVGAGIEVATLHFNPVSFVVPDVSRGVTFTTFFMYCISLHELPRGEGDSCMFPVRFLFCCSKKTAFMNYIFFVNLGCAIKKINVY